MRRWLQPLYRFGERAHGWNVFERLDQLRAMVRWSGDQVREWQLHQLRSLADHAYRNVPFYAQLWRDAGVQPSDLKSLDDLVRFPRVTKSMLIKAGPLCLDQSADHNRFVYGRTSGSTGAPFVYYKTREHQSWIIASVLLGYTWTGWEPGDPWMRLQFRKTFSLRSRLEDWAFRCLYAPINELDASSLHHYVNRAVHFRPKLIRGMSDGMYVFARYLLDTQDTRLAPTAVVTTGQTLYDHYRSALERAFQTKVMDTYGGEGMMTASQCERGLYHVFPPVHVETVPDGSPTSDGQPSRLLLTGLTNTAMPMIRYDIGDLAVPATGACSCGRSWPMLKRILGRETDVIVTPDNHNLVCDHFHRIFQELPGVDGFQIIQESRDRITVRIEPNGRYDRFADEERIRERLGKLMGNSVELSVAYVTSIPVATSGKRRYVISNVPSSFKSTD